jgi:signal transduction histidine kinase/CheY-like chemotaxis protein
MATAFIPFRRLPWPALLRGGQARTAGPDADGRFALSWLRATLVLSILVPWAVFAAVALYTHGAALEEAERRVVRLTAIAHEHALKLFETADLLIRQADLLAGTNEGAPRREDPRLSEQLKDLTRGLHQVHSIWMLDADGNAIASSRAAPRPGLNFADRPVFRAHLKPGTNLVLTPPRVGKATQEVFFDLSRRRETADGRFDGITLVGLYPTYFTSFYQELADSERGILLTLLHEDGRIMARWPQAPATADRMAPTSALAGPLQRGEMRGVVRGTSSFDGITRVGGFQRIGRYPAYVYAGTDQEAALARWRRDLALLAAFLLPLSACLALISWQALRRTQKHLEAARELRAEAQERQRVEAALRQSQKLEAMGHLTGGVAHDFNNLLMVVNLNVTLLRQKLREPAYERQLDAIERSVSAGKKLTRQLLAFSRRQPLMPKVLDLAALMPSLLDLIRPALGSRASLEGSVAPGTPRVRLDGGELELALINLAVNARDAMPQGGTVRIDVREVDGFVELAFRDTGVGIAPEDLDRVFEPFFTTKPVGAGTGLGLSQVYGLCARAGGSARVESRPGQGTTVFLRFPAVRDDSLPSGDMTLPRAGWLAPLSLRVLLVEDNADIASATREVLEAAGCSVRHVLDPAAALRALADGPACDVVLSDIVMPGGMDGLQLAAELRRRWPELPLVLMTGYAEKLGEAEAQGLLVLPKPFEPQLLLSTLREQVQLAGGASGTPELRAMRQV